MPKTTPEHISVVQTINMLELFTKAFQAILEKAKKQHKRPSLVVVKDEYLCDELQTSRITLDSLSETIAYSVC